MCLMGRYRKYYDTLSLAKLRKRQYITTLQMKYAYRHKKIRALIRLQRIHLMLSDSIMRRFTKYENVKGEYGSQGKESVG